ncbi:MAG: phosphoribosylaminoimidazolecarboxamide formyltransferase [Bacillota bacterium]|nr:phosphoribosylaminoimidazolecarboxamide formyltransferase [Bacillota bacterium]
MKEFTLKYGCNPNQKTARIYMEEGKELPIKILNGRPGYINFLDAFNSWQLVKELKEATGMPAAASFKHVSPTSAAVGEKLTDRMKRAYFVDDIEGLDDSPIACAYARARGTDRLCSFGDFIALSDICDETCARIIKREVSDGVIAPGFTDKALDMLNGKKNGNYSIIEIDPEYEPAQQETRQVYGVTFEQTHNSIRIDAGLLQNIVTANRALPEDKKRDMLIAMIALKYTQSNSVCFAADGQCIGIGAGQQSRIHCTRLAADKADTWQLRMHDKVLELPFKDKLPRAVRDNAIDGYINEYEEDVCEKGNWQKYFKYRPEPLTAREKREYLDSRKGAVLASDAFFPFGDSIERAALSGASYVVEPGGSLRDDDVIQAADRHGMVMVFNGVRLFHH